MDIICSRVDTVKEKDLGEIRRRKWDHWLAFCIGRRNHDSTGSNRGIESAYLKRCSLMCSIRPSFCTYCVADSKKMQWVSV